MFTIRDFSLPRAALSLKSVFAYFSGVLLSCVLGSCIQLGVQFEKDFILLALVMKIAGLLHLSD